MCVDGRKVRMKLHGAGADVGRQFNEEVKSIVRPSAVAASVAEVERDEFDEELM